MCKLTFMLKFILAAVFLLVMGDLAINHGTQTKRVVALGSGLGHWVTSSGEDSIFSK